MNATDRTWVLPDEPLPVRLMNTIWAERGIIHEDLQHPADAVAWLRSAGFTPTAVTPAQLRSVRELRDALRRAAAFVTDDTRPAAVSAITDVSEAVTIINDRAADAAPTDRLIVDDEGLTRRPTPVDPVTEGLAAVSHAAVDLLSDANQKLRACQAPGCVLYFVQSHPRREWCSVACGNRARAARHYLRHHSDAGD